MSGTEKAEVLTKVTSSGLPKRRALGELGVPKSTYYRWLRRKEQQGLEDHAGGGNPPWNKLTSQEVDFVLSAAREMPELSCLQLAAWTTGNMGFSVSESTVYRILRREGLVKRPEMRLAAGKEYHRKTTGPHQMWATDASYFREVGWGYYLVTVMDDYSRFILAHRLQRDMTSDTVTTLKWVNYEQSAVVAGRNIGGMVYLGPYQGRGSLSATWKPTIVPTLPVAASGPDITGDGMPYWPSYSEIGPNSRAAYLDWLATGRSDRRYGVGHVFLYFYGLERRFFIDSSGPHERRIIIDEVDRLLQIYGDHRSVRRYFESFLDAAKVSLASDEELKPRFWTAGYELPLGLRVALGRRAGDGLPLNADWALSWYCAHPDYALRTAASRAFPEFQAIFRILFAERYPAGMKIPLPKRTLRAQYQSASSDFEVGLEEHIGTVPDISRITQPLNAARNLVEEATDSLDKYSRFLGRNPNGRGTIEAHALLPERLWEVFPSSEMDSLREWAGEIIDAGGLCPVEAVVERLEGAAPESIGKRQLTDAADALARLSVGLAPDPRFALRSPKRGEPVVLFNLPEGVTRLEAVSGKYKSLLVSVAIGSFVAQADE